jgi:hypothetical protein
MYEMSRAVLTRDFIYIRHFMPQLPYIQPGYISSNVKESYRELRRLHMSGELHAEAEEMWQQKPAEEFYDLRHDPEELTNMINDDEHGSTIAELRSKMHSWMKETKDLGLLAEPEYLIMAGDSSPYEFARSDHYAVEQILDAAELVGKVDEQQILPKLKDSERGVRYWAVMAINNMEAPGQLLLDSLIPLLEDPSPSVQIITAETLCKFNKSELGLPVLQKWIEDDRLWLALQAARSAQLIGDEVCPIVDALEAVQKTLFSEDGKRKYKDFNYASFTGWALEGALRNCGKDAGWVE